MNSKLKYLVKNTVLLAASNFASKILVFLLVPLYTSVLSTTEYGTYDLAVSTASLMYPLLTLNVVDAVMRFTLDKDYSNEEVTKIGYEYVSLSCLIFGGLLFLVYRFRIWNDIYGLEFLVFGYYVSYVFNQFFIQLAKGLERVVDMAIAGVVGTSIMLFANLLCLLVFKMGLKGFFLANIIAQIVPAVYFFVRLKAWKYISFEKNDKQLRSEMLKYSVPLIATVLGWWVNSTSDKYVVAFMCGVAANGILSVAYKIPQIINTLQGIFIQAWQISAIKEYGERETAKFYGNSFSIINLLMCMACSWLILLSKFLAAILYVKDFYIAWQYVPFLLISCVLNCAAGLLGPILSAKKDSKTMMWSGIIGAMANVILNIGFVYIFGIQGATIATVLSSYIIYWIRKNAIRKDIVIDKYFIVEITWGLLCVQAVIEIYSGSIWIEILIMLVMLLINKDKEFEILKVFSHFIKDKMKK